MVGSRRGRIVTGCLWGGGIFILLAMAFHLIVTWRFESQSDAIAQEMAARGYPATLEELIDQHSRTSSAPNGVGAFKRAMGLIDETGINFDLMPVMSDYHWPLPPEPVPKESIEEIRKLVAQNKDALQLAADAVRVETFLYPLAPNSTASVLDNDVAFWGQIARLWSLQSLERAESGDLDSAIDTVESILLLGKRGCQQPTVTAFLVGHAIAGIGQSASIRLVERGYLTEPEHFDRLAALLDTFESPDPVYAVWTDALLTEMEYARRKAPAKTIRGIANAPNPGEELKELIQPIIYKHTPMGALDRRDHRRLILEMSKIFERDDGNLIEKLRRTKSLEPAPGRTNWLRPLSARFRVSGTTPGITGISRVRFDATATALRILKFRLEHGRLPNQREYREAIGPPLDPFRGDPLRYVVEDGNIVVYAEIPAPDGSGGPESNDEDRHFMADNNVIRVRIAPLPE